jgi:hypothetical protein
MVKKNSGILYCLSNELWKSKLKCGLTTQKLQKRISNLQTSLFIDCKIVYHTEELVNCKIYEYLLKKILKEYRERNDREFYNIEPYEIKEIFENFNYINSILNTPEKLNEYIKNNHPEYFRLSKKRLYSEMCSDSEESLSNYNQIVKKIRLSNDERKKKKRKGLYVDTSY